MSCLCYNMAFAQCYDCERKVVQLEQVPILHILISSKCLHWNDHVKTLQSGYLKIDLDIWTHAHISLTSEHNTNLGVIFCQDLSLRRLYVVWMKASLWAFWLQHAHWQLHDIRNIGCEGVYSPWRYTGPEAVCIRLTLPTHLWPRLACPLITLRGIHFTLPSAMVTLSQAPGPSSGQFKSGTINQRQLVSRWVWNYH